jgi:Mrp family chromosome partitioning ATPase
MTSTDRAFIRAFRRDAGSSTTPSPQNAEVDITTVAPVHAASAEVAGLSSEGLLEGFYTVEECTCPSYAIEAPKTSASESAAAPVDRTASERYVPQPHIPLSPTPNVRQSSSNALTAPQPSSGQVRPLSSFVDPTSEESPQTPEVSAPTVDPVRATVTSSPAPSPTLPTESTEAAAQEPFFQAALEVDQFLYPRECERLLSEVGDAFDQVARKLLGTSEMGHRVIAVAGCRRGEGRSTGLLCIARRLAALGARVAVVDADFEKPDLAVRLGLAVPAGWDDVLRGELGLEEAVVETRGEQISLVPLREPVVNADASELGRRAADDLVTLGRHFDVVLVDLGPVLDPRGDAVAFAQAAGIPAALLVRDARRASQADFTAAASRLSSAKVAVIGSMETFAGPDVLPLPRPSTPMAKAG